MRSDRWLVVRMIREELNLTHNTFHKILTNKLEMRKINNTWVLHHDNAPCDTAISINEILASKNIPVASQSPHSPDLGPCDFFSSRS